jgi:glutaredoxin
MSAALDPRYFFNSRLHPAPEPGFRGAWIDLAREPSSAHELIRLGVSPRHDLPALTLSESGGRLRLLGLRLLPAEAERLSSSEPFVGARVEVFGAAWCPDTRRLRDLLDRHGQTYEEVNVDQDAKAEALVLARSGGRRVTPTVLVDERIWLFNPEAGLVERFLASAA